MRHFDLGVSTLLVGSCALALVPSCGNASDNPAATNGAGDAGYYAGEPTTLAGSPNEAGGGGRGGNAGSASTRGGEQSGGAGEGGIRSEAGSPSGGAAGDAGAGGQAAAVSHIAVAYDIVEVKGPGSSVAQNRSINDAGLVVGRYYQNSVSVTYTWTVADGRKDVSDLNGYSLPLEVNNLGVLCAYEGDAVATRVGFSTLDGTYKQMPSIMGYPYYSPESINDSNVIVGGTAGAGHRAFLLSGGKYTLFDVLPNGTGSYAQGINNNGTVVGWAIDKDGHALPVVFDDNVPQVLGTLGGTEGYANRINDQGSVVGYAQVMSGDYHAFYYAGGKLEDLGVFGGTYSYAAGINNGDVVVGNSTTNTGSTAFAWSADDGMIDLATRLDGATGWTLSSAIDINSSGQIVGYGNHDGAAVGFVMTPKP